MTIFRPSDGANGTIEAKLWPQLLSSRADKRLTQMTNDVFRMNAEGVQLLPDSHLVVLFEEHSVPLDLQGDGTRAAFRCLMLLATLQSTLYVLEEPECHQHPGSLERFAEVLCKHAKQQEVQLLIATHSAECVRSFLAGAEKSGSSSAVFHLQLEDGLLEASRLDAEAVQSLHATGVDVRYLNLYR